MQTFPLNMPPPLNQGEEESAAGVKPTTAPKVPRQQQQAAVQAQQPRIKQKNLVAPRNGTGYGAGAGIGNGAGLGKVFYFLDQMKTEVTDADRTIKSLQKDMKFMVSCKINDFNFSRVVHLTFCTLLAEGEK